MKSFMSLSRSLAKRRKGRHQRSEGRPPAGPRPARVRKRRCARPRRYAHVHWDESAAESPGCSRPGCASELKSFK